METDFDSIIEWESDTSEPETEEQKSAETDETSHRVWSQQCRGAALDVRAAKSSWRERDKALWRRRGAIALPYPLFTSAAAGGLSDNAAAEPAEAEKQTGEVLPLYSPRRSQQRHTAAEAAATIAAQFEGPGALREDSEERRESPAQGLARRRRRRAIDDFPASLSSPQSTSSSSERVDEEAGASDFGAKPCSAAVSGLSRRLRRGVAARRGETGNLEQQLEQEFLKECEEVFCIRNTQNKKRLPLTDLALLLQSMGLFISSAAQQQLRRLLQMRGIHSLSFRRFCACALTLRRQQRRHRDWDAAPACAESGDVLCDFCDGDAVKLTTKLVDAYCLLGRRETKHSGVTVHDLAHYMTHFGDGKLTLEDWEILKSITYARGDPRPSLICDFNDTTASCPPVLLSSSTTHLDLRAFLSMFAGSIEDFV